MELTIDALAQRAELPSSTIRMYQHRGLLPPPRKVGRVGWYDDGHVARLELIASLQERGYSLAAIGELVDGWEAGRSLDDVLGLERAVAGAAGEPLRLSVAELAERFPNVPITEDVVRRVTKLGVAELDAETGDIVVHEPAFLGVGSALVELGFPLDEVLDEYEHLRPVLAGVAERFAALFERHVWRPFADAGMPERDLPSVTGALERLGPLADHVVQATLRQALAEVAERFVADEAARATPVRKRAARRRSR